MHPFKKNIRADRLFDIVNHLIIIIFCISAIYPFLHLLSQSISSENVSLTKIYLIPPEITFDNYAKVLSNEYIHSGFKMSIIRTVIGTFLSLVITICCAYPLSKKHFPHRTFWTAIIVFTMFFNGGMIPRYLVVKNLGLIDSIWALVLPRLIDTFALLIMRNYFMSLPEELEESATIDGADTVTVLYKIIIPISKPIIATVVLWTAVWHWNTWFDSLIYIQDQSKQVLQIVLRRIVLQGTSQITNISLQDETQRISPETIKAATVMVVTMPILIVYPFLQKYFVKGVMVGSLKG